MLVGEPGPVQGGAPLDPHLEPEDEGVGRAEGDLEATLGVRRRDLRVGPVVGHAEGRDPEGELGGGLAAIYNDLWTQIGINPLQREAIGNAGTRLKMAMIRLTQANSTKR